MASIARRISALNPVRLYIRDRLIRKLRILMTFGGQESARLEGRFFHVNHAPFQRFVRVHNAAFNMPEQQPRAAWVAKSDFLS
jgi:hypothetical protein